MSFGSTPRAIPAGVPATAVHVILYDRGLPVVENTSLSPSSKLFVRLDIVRTSDGAIVVSRIESLSAGVATFADLALPESLYVLRASLTSAEPSEVQPQIAAIESLPLIVFPESD